MTDLLQNDTSARPANVPEKFWDVKNNSIRTDALLKSYAELEKKLGAMIHPTDTAKMQQALGVPASAADYCIDCSHGLFTPHPDINAELHGAGFTQPQAQKVYDLAAQHMVPMIVDVANQYQSEGELQRLQDHFGGAAQWQEMARQLQAWGNANLPPEAVRGLSSTYDGIMAMYNMMQQSLGQDGTPSANVGNAASANGAQDITAMMRDPRYWQKKDPNYIAQVTAAFERQYGNA